MKKASLTISSAMGILFGALMLLFLFWVGATSFNLFEEEEKNPEFNPELNLIWPVSTTDRVVTSCYGTKILCGENEDVECKQFEGKNHPGIDIKGQENRPVVAVVDGVLEIESDLSLSLTSGDGKFSYFHIVPKRELDGKEVKQGGEIGIIGPVNKFSNSPHLHFESFDNAVRKNPLCFLSGQYLFEEGISCGDLRSICN